MKTQTLSALLSLTLYQIRDINQGIFCARAGRIYPARHGAPTQFVNPLTNHHIKYTITPFPPVHKKTLMVSGRIKFRYSICLPLFIALFLVPRAAHGASLYSDISVGLAIEIGNDLHDYADAGLAVEKGRFVEYKITITNNGDIPHSDVVVQMDNPDYMVYVPGTTYMDIGSDYNENIPDSGSMSSFNTGYVLDNIDPGQSVSFYTQYRVQVPENVLDDPLYTLAWASVSDVYSGIPVLSQTVETTISSEAKPIVQSTVEVLPGPETPISPGMQIVYNYNLHNVGGVATSEITLTTYLPENTTCVSGCGTFKLDSLQPNEESIPHTMIFTVNPDFAGATTMNINYDVSGENFDKIEHRETIELSVTDGSGYGGVYGSGYAQELNQFTLIINQVPNFILNSADGVNARPDKADLTETQYTLLYGGRGQPYTYQTISDTGNSVTTRPCGSYTHPNKFGAYFYAYSSDGDQNSESLSGIGLSSAPIEFNVNTVLPETSPKLEFTVNTPMYSFGTTTDVNGYMQNGGSIDIPGIPEVGQAFTESRAVENGAMGIVSSEVTANVLEDLWQYKYAGRDEYLCTRCHSCGDDDTCCDDYYRPVYTWQKVGSSNVELKDDDTTNISVYTSTAWLKTQGGHIGTNDSFTNEAGTFGSLDVNLVDLPFYEDINNDDDYYHRENGYLKTDHPTSSSEYTPPGEFNAEYMVFGNVGVGDMKTSCGQNGESDCESWYATGFTPFRNENEGASFVQKGDAYDRINNPRNYDNTESPDNPSDLIDREKFGEVRTNELPTTLTGTVELGDNVIWNNGTSDITIGSGAIDDDVVVFSGGQARIYTKGDVYIKGDIKYQTSRSSDYNNITSVRIDARNIYVDGEVEDIEAMLLARGEFHSGVSKKQLRILGDVIAGKTFWEREPLLQFDVEEINQPSEYIIEDMRKYVVPAPGDTELPDDYTIWRQVNPATGEVLDGY